jgi:hypothetical protein
MAKKIKSHVFLLLLHDHHINLCTYVVYLYIQLHIYMNQVKKGQS